jgi:hypothetical protein
VEVSEQDTDSASKPESGLKNQAADGRFRPGQSGNPSGKPPGTRSRANQIVERLFLEEGDLETIARKVVDAAKAGEQWAIQAILTRVAPPRKSAPVKLDLPKIAGAPDLVAAMAVVIEAVAAGEIDPEEATAVAALLETKRRTIETAEHEARLAALEASSNGTENS